MLYGCWELNLLAQCTTTASAAWWCGSGKLISVIFYSVRSSSQLPVLVSQTALILLITPFLSVIVSCWTLDTMDLIMVPRIIIIAHSDRSKIYKLTRQQQEDASVIGKMWNKKFSLGGNIIFPTIYISDRSAQIICIQAAYLSLSFKDPTWIRG